MNIASIDEIFFYPEHLTKLRSLGKVKIYNTHPKDHKEALQRVLDADIIINFWYPMPQKLLSLLRKTKLIVVAAVGYEWINTKAAKQQNITVCNCPRHNGEAVAEHTIGLMLHAIRLASQAENDLRSGMWDPSKYKGIELRHKTLGIIGSGFIGKRVAEIAQKGLEMNIITINSKNDRKDLVKLLRESDVISINAPLTKLTKNMLGEKEFAIMKPGVAIVNTGRGAIINQDAFVHALNQRKVSAAGLDAFPIEPIEKDNPLLLFSNVVMTPHIGWNTVESEYRLSEMVVDNIEKFLAGKPQNVVV